MSNYTIFISDLHLSPTEPEITNLFLKFIEDISPTTDALYILGDFFKFWVGDDDTSVFNEQIKKALQLASSKTTIYLMSGNRDFILGQTFAKESGCILITDPYKIDLYQRPTLLTHGDILCTKDIKHRMFRAITRIPCGISIFLKLPLTIRTWFARNLQKYSAKTKLSKDKNTMLPQISAIRKLMVKFDCNQIIHGHTHIIETEEFTVNDQKMRRISLGEWTDHGSILIYHSDGQYEFKRI
ncbi:MAG: UDP-2,3-diacylglucosamine hydrolase [uncultured bacterium]|nr:MAG: UDP-2,3-diacylglucosamine hydrolase [uncultured bacterium]